MPDLLCYDDLDPLGREVASPLDALEQDLYHRLIEAPHSNPDDPDAGIGLEQRLSGPINAVQLARDIEIDFQKDPRVNSTSVTITDTGGGVYQLDVAVDGDAGQLAISILGSAGNVQRIA